MNDSCTARKDALRQDGQTELCARMARLEKSNARLKFGLAGASMLVVGMALGGLAMKDDPIVAYTTTDDTMYRVYESGNIEYLRLENGPPRTVEGVFDWGVVKIDDRFKLEDRP